MDLRTRERTAAAGHGDHVFLNDFRRKASSFRKTIRGESCPCRNSLLVATPSRSKVRIISRIENHCALRRRSVRKLDTHPENSFGNWMPIPRNTQRKETKEGRKKGREIQIQAILRMVIPGHIYHEKYELHINKFYDCASARSRSRFFSTAFPSRLSYSVGPNDAMAAQLPRHFSRVI